MGFKDNLLFQKINYPEYYESYTAITGDKKAGNANKNIHKKYVCIYLNDSGSFRDTFCEIFHFDLPDEYAGRRKCLVEYSPVSAVIESGEVLRIGVPFPYLSRSEGFYISKSLDSNYMMESFFMVVYNGSSGKLGFLDETRIRKYFEKENICKASNMETLKKYLSADCFFCITLPKEKHDSEVIVASSPFHDSLSIRLAPVICKNRYSVENLTGISYEIFNGWSSECAKSVLIKYFEFDNFVKNYEVTEEYLKMIDEIRPKFFNAVEGFVLPTVLKANAEKIDSTLLFAELQKDGKDNKIDEFSRYFYEETEKLDERLRITE